MSVKITVRVMRPSDIQAVVAIDAKITGAPRPHYFERRLEIANRQEAQINASLVAEDGGSVIGFLVGTLFFSEFGSPENSAVVDAMGVDPGDQDRGVGGVLFEQFLNNIQAVQVERIYTLVDWKDFALLKFFENMGFVPSERLTLECAVPKPPMA